MATFNLLKGLCNVLSNSDLMKMILGITATEVVDSSSEDIIPTMLNCRAISVNTDGVSKFDFVDDSGENTTTEVKTMKAGVLYQYRNVSKVYQHYTGTSDVTTVYKITGGSASLVPGLKLHR